VELGVFEIRPFVSDFSFLRKVSEISPARIARWEKLAQAATQQSGRGDVLSVRPAVTLEQLLKDFNQQPSTAGLFPYEGEAQVRLTQAIQEAKAKNPENLWLFVGSEGGFSPREVQIFGFNGLKPVSMGSQILRVETACVALVSIIKYEAGALS
jgi:16S rRNA (uracil1498-N3)-methyltransferase